MTNKSWLLTSSQDGEDAPVASDISVEEAVERLLSESSMVIDVRNQFLFRTEAVDKCVNIPVRRAEGSKLSPTYVIVGKDAFIEALEASGVAKDRSVVFVGGEDVDEQAGIAARYAAAAGFQDVAIVRDTVAQWLKRFTASGKPKRVLAAGAYKSDLLTKGAFNPFAGES